MIYILIIFVSVIISIFSVDKRCNVEYNWFFFTIAIITLSFIAGIRTIGHDFEVYEMNFRTIPALNNFVWEDTSIELGYTFIVSLFKIFSDSFHLFLFVFTITTFILSYHLFNKYSYYSLLSFFMFFSFSYFIQIMGQMRQPIAVIITLLVVIPLLKKRKKLLSALFILLSTFLLHKSIIFFLPFVFISDYKFKKKSIFILLTLSFIIFCFSSLLSKVLISIVPKGTLYSDTIIAYLTYKSMAVTFTLGMVERLGMVLLLIYISFKYNVYMYDDNLRIFINMYFVGVCLYFAFISISAEFASRGTIIYNYGLFIAMPSLIKYVDIKMKYLILSIICAWGIYLCSGVFSSENSIYIPYKSILI